MKQLWFACNFGDKTRKATFTLLLFEVRKRRHNLNDNCKSSNQMECDNEDEKLM